MLVLFMLVYASPKSVRLKRTFTNHGMELSYLREMDMQIYGRMLKPRVVNLLVDGTGPHYNLNLESISVNGHMLQIDPEDFEKSSKKGAIIDSGTTMAYFVEGAYNPIVDAITGTILLFVATTDSNASRCYSLATSVLSINDIFPSISLNFANNSSLVLRPQDYLLPFPSFDGRM